MGALSLHLLPTGLIGIMLSGMLLGHMPARWGWTAVSVSGLVVRNIYEPLLADVFAQAIICAPDKFIIFLVLGLSILIAWQASSLGSLTTIMITFNTFFGAVVFLLFFWRRLTVPAILVAFFIWIFLQALVPVIMSLTPLPQVSELTRMTNGYTRKVYRAALAEDVTAGTAKAVGDKIEEDQKIAPVAMFFDKVVPMDAAKPEASVKGDGHFIVEDYLLYYPLKVVGVKMEEFKGAAGLDDGTVVSRTGFFPCMLDCFLMDDAA